MNHNRIDPIALLVLLSMLTAQLSADDAVSGNSNSRVYENRLTPLGREAGPLLADYPEFIEPVDDVARFESPRLIDDASGDLDVRAWRFSYHARGIIEIPNRLTAKKTALVVVHPWGIDDSQGWRSPEPAGVAFACTPVKNRVMHEHAARVLNPLLERLRPAVGLVVYSLPGERDPIRRRLYRSLHDTPSAADRDAAALDLREKLAAFDYRGQAIPARIELTSGKPAIDYFRTFPGLDATARYNGAGFWDLPIPVMEEIRVQPDDVALYDKQGYPALRDFLTGEGIEHVLLAGYHADMCVCRTTAGYENLRKDFNVFLVGDAVLATFPANGSPRFATNQAVSFASLDVFITQASWIKRSTESRSQ